MASILPQLPSGTPTKSRFCSALCDGNMPIVSGRNALSIASIIGPECIVHCTRVNIQITVSLVTSSLLAYVAFMHQGSAIQIRIADRLHDI